MDARFRDLSVLTETERSAKTIKVMPSLPASSDVASTSSLETEILPPPKKKSKSEEELLDKGKSSNSSGESMAQVESRAEMNQRINREIQQLSNEAPIGLTEGALMWWKENPLVRNLAARVRAAPPTSVPSEQIFSNTGLVVSKKRVLNKNIM